MGTGYTKTDPTEFVDGDVINASDFNNEFSAIDSAFETTGHTHDGTDGEGGAISKLLANSITIGTGAADTDIIITVDGETNDGVLTWKEDEDYFEFSDDLLIASTEKIQFRDTALYIYSSVDGQLDLVADSTVAITGNATVSGDLTVTGTFSAGDTNITNVGDIALDSISADGTQIDIVLTDNDSAALDITESTNSYLKFDTTNTAEKIVLGKKLEAGSVEIEGSNFDINGGNIDGTTIGGSSAAVGTFTTANATTVDTTNIEVTNIKAKDGTSAGSIADSTGVVTLASSVLTTADINGGTIDSVTIGGTTAAAGTFTTLTANGNVTLGDAATDTVTVTADIASDLIPSADSTHDLGDSSNYWANAYIDAITTTGNVVVGGDLQITGSTVQIDVTNLEVDDNLILVNNGIAGASNTNDSGILIERGTTGDNAAIIWDESADGFIVGTTTQDGSTTGDMTITAAPFTAAAGTFTTLSLSNASEPLVISSSGRSLATFTSTDATASQGPNLVLQRDSASPAVSDVLGQIIFQGEDSASNVTAYGQLGWSINDPTDTSEDGAFVIKNIIGGTLSTIAQADQNGWNFQSYNITTTGTLAAGATTLTGTLDVSQGNVTGSTASMLTGADANATSRTNITNKFFTLGGVHYTNAEEPIALMSYSSTSSATTLYIGSQPNGTFNVPTEIQLRTGASITATGGVAALTLDSSQNATFAGNVETKYATSGGSTGSGMFVTNSNDALNDYANIIFGVTSGNNTAYHKGGIFFQAKDANRNGDMVFALTDAADSTNVTASNAVLTLSQDSNATFASDVTAEGYNLSAIATDIADTAVDVFVYDTNKDSDGGAWRHRTQNTSWYNETLNTATRGSRKEFPAVAVIVAEAATITIYDGDDPDLPMWMVFDPSAGNTITSISALNGQIWIGFSNVWPSLGVINFLADFAELRDDRVSNGTNRRVWLPLAASYYDGYSSLTTTTAIVDEVVNDVAMTVLPNAPLDADTGLPVPTIGVATEGGLSVITDSGNVYDITSSAAADEKSTSVEFSDSNDLIFNMTRAGDGANSTLLALPIPSGDINIQTVTTYRQYKSDYGSIGPSTKLQTLIGSPDFERYGGSGFTDYLAALKDNTIAAGIYAGDAGFHLIAEDTSNGLNSMVARINSSYNTGYMVGDIKLAALSDTDATNVTGSELVTNGDFTTDTSGWSSGNSATLTQSSGTLNVAYNGVSYGYAYQNITTVVGKTYTFKADITATSSNSPFIAVNLDQVGGDDYSTTSSSSVRTDSITFIATSTTTQLKLYLDGTTSGNANFDNVSVRIADIDRSVNGNGLQVFGTVNKTAVATGAELVAYSGWSTSNYLKQPINSDLQGANNRTFVCWFKTSSTSNYQYLFSVGNESDSVYGLAIHQTTGLLYAYDTVNSSDITSSPNVADDVWHQVVLVDDGSNKKVYLDGVLLNTTSISAYTVDTDEAYCVGVSAGVTGIDYPFLGSLALQRFSHTVASAAQIKKMYNDEKYLFQDNADATLYGSSDAITALAYDDRTELLHAGTSAGRSVFQGLRRVDNTTDAVGATISASNGLVADD